MKRLFLVVLILCAVFYGNAFAGPAFGVRGGLNLANASQDPSEGLTQKIKLGFMFGGNAEFSLSSSNKTTLRLEGLYVQKGWIETATISVFNVLYDYEGTFYVDELVLAPFLVLRFPSENMTPFLQGGPELGLNLSAKGRIEIDGESETDDIADWSSTNFGINIGGGVAIPSGSGEVVIDARYNLGLMNLYSGSGDWTIKTNGIQLCVGYNFSVPTKGK
jgi:hypothetical protein